MTEISVGVIGGGGITQIAHLPVLSRADNTRVVAVCDNDVGKARSLAERFGVPDAYDDIEELLARTQPDAVVIATPNHLHEVHVQTALAAGAHVLCERPLATNSQSVESVIAAHRESDRVLMVGMNSRYRNDVQALRGFLQRGELGELRGIRAGWYFFKPSRNALGWRLNRAKSGGGVMLDLGLSLVDLALWLAGYPEPVKVSGTYNWDETSGDIEDAGCALIECRSGLSIIVDVSWRYLGKSEKFWFEVLGTTGSASLAPLRVYREMHGQPIDVTPSGAIERENQFTASYRAEWASFMAAVRGDVTPPTLADQLTMHRVLEAINQSVQQGHDVAL